MDNNEKKIIVLKKPSKQQRMYFITSVVVTVALVAIGWLFNLRNIISLDILQAPDSEILQIKEGFQGVKGDIQVNTKKEVDEMRGLVIPVVDAIVEPVVEGVEQRERVIETVSEIIKKDIENR